MFVEFLAWLAQAVLEHWIILLLGVGGVPMLRALKELKVFKERWPLVSDMLLYALLGLGFSIIFILLLALTDQQKEVSDGLTEVTDRQAETSAQQTRALERQTGVLEKLTKKKPARPYFTHTKSEIQKPSVSRRTLVLSLRNHGAPANDIVTQLLLLDNSLDPTRKPLHSERVDSATP